MVTKLQREELCWPLSIELNDGNPDNGTFTYSGALKMGTISESLHRAPN